jgi:hypothetical protein
LRSSDVCERRQCHTAGRETEKASAGKFHSATSRTTMVCEPVTQQRLF